MKNQFINQAKVRREGKASAIILRGLRARREGKPPVTPYKRKSKDASLWLMGWGMASAHQFDATPNPKGLQPFTSDFTSVDCVDDPEIAKMCKAIPEHKLKPRPRAKPETTLVRECIAWCRAQGLFVWRNNTGTFQMGNRWLKFSIVGAPDIIGLLPNGKFLGIECKVKPNKQSDTQKHFEANITTNKGVYIVVYSVYELANKLPLGWKVEK